MSGRARFGAARPAGRPAGRHRPHRRRAARQTATLLAVAAVATAGLVGPACAPGSGGQRLPGDAAPSPTAPATAATPAAAIRELDTAPAIDGRLAEWPAADATTLAHRNGPEMGPAPRAWLAYDAGHLYLALDVPDDTLAFPERSWRFGDGFYLTVLMPGGGTRSDAHMSFGFSRVGDRLEKVVVNRSGEYFPRVSTGDVAFAMEPGPASVAAPDGGSLPWGGSATYEVAVPWTLLAPAHPLAADSLAVNVVVSDRDGGDARSFHMLAPDPGFDTERTAVRRGAMLPLVRRATPGSPADAADAADAADPADPDASDPEASDSAATADAVITAWLAAPVLRAGGEDTVRVAVAAGVEGAVRVEVRRDHHPIGTTDVPLPGGGGPRRVAVPVRVPAGAGTGAARIIAAVGGPDGPRIERPVFVVDPAQLDAIRQRLGGRTDAVALAAPSALIRLDWIDAFAASAPSNMPVEPAVAWWAEAGAMAADLAVGSVGFLYRPGPRRLAHRSGVDGTLQPYSIQLPPDFDPGRPGGYPLLVALHGSGVDERGTLRTAGARATREGWIVVAPGGRGLSDWYVGDAETDVLEVLDHVAALFPVDTTRVALAGFSMGGYGAWRLALRHPRRFRAVAILAGADCPPSFVDGECASALLAAREPDAPRPPLLVLHGALDRSVPVARARDMVEALQDARWPHRYTEFPDAGHGRAEWWDRVMEWLVHNRGISSEIHP